MLLSNKYIILSVSGAIKCIEENGSDQTVDKCDNSYNACSVLWTGDSSAEAVITQRACWIDADTDIICNVGPCVPKKLKVNIKISSNHCLCCSAKTKSFL